jgi:predicted XRE-type DNA-binding protein
MKREELSEAPRQVQEHDQPTYTGVGERIEQLLRQAEDQAAELVEAARSEADAIKAAARADAAALQAVFALIDSADLKAALALLGAQAAAKLVEHETPQGEEHWPTLEETEAEDRAAGRLDEAAIAEHRERMRDAQRAYRLTEIRKSRGLTQTDLAAAMHVSQRRVSAVKHGDLTRTNLGTVATYVAALGGRIEIVASFGDERIIIG